MPKMERQQPQQYSSSSPSPSYTAARAVTAATIGGSLLILSGLTLSATVISLTVATPVLVIFSPVLVPAAFTVFLLLTGVLSSGGLGIAALSVLSWTYKNITGKHPTGADQLDLARMAITNKASATKERAEQYAQAGTANAS